MWLMYDLIKFSIALACAILRRPDQINSRIFGSFKINEKKFDSYGAATFSKSFQLGRVMA